MTKAVNEASLAGQLNVDANGVVQVGKTTTVDSTNRMEVEGKLYIPKVGVGGGAGSTRNSVRNLRFGDYGRLQHSTFVNQAMMTFNAELYDSDYIGSGSGTSTNTNTLRPDYSGGAWGMVSPNNGGVGFNTGRWNSATSLEIGDSGSHSSFAGGVNPDGIWNFPKQPAFTVNGSGSGALAAGDIAPFNNALTNIGSYYNTSTYRFTAPVAGRYMFTFNIYGFNTYYGTYCFRVNNVEWPVNGAPALAYKYGTAEMTTGFSVVLNLAANDYVSVNGRSGQATHYYGPHSIFSGYLIG
jgi:hypothetical protein